MSDDASRLALIRERNNRLRQVPFETHGENHGPGCPACELVRGIDDVQWLLAMSEAEAARLRAVVADEHSRLSQDLDNAEEVRQLRDLNRHMARYLLRAYDRAAVAEEALAELRKQIPGVALDVEWGVQWIDGDGKPFGRYWPGKTEAVRTVTNNHASGDGRAQLLNRFVSEPAIADVEIVGVEGAGDD